MPLHLVVLLALQQSSPSVATIATVAPAARTSAERRVVRDAGARVPPVLHAVRATAGAPRIDGRLSDHVFAVKANYWDSW